jgi:periplasmic protein CpxP/Spy
MSHTEFLKRWQNISWIDRHMFRHYFQYASKGVNMMNTRNSRLTGLLLFGWMMLLPLTMLHAGAGSGPAERGAGGPDAGTRMSRVDAREMFDNLDLSTDQVRKLKTHKMNNRRTIIRLRSELDLLKADMFEAALAGEPDMKQIEGISRQIGDVQARMTLERMKSLIYLRSILTDEQKKVMDSHHLMFSTIDGRGRK